MPRVIVVEIYEDDNLTDRESFNDDELTSGADLAQRWLKLQDGDPLDE